MPSNIHEAVNAVMQEVGYVKKSRSNGLNYSYAGEAALIAALRPAMVEQGIYMHVQDVTFTRENYTTAKGTAMVNTVARAVIRFTHAPSGTFIDVAALGEGSDAGDKSANKAMTGLYKYAMRQTFCIETGDDPDKYASEERKEEARPVKQEMSEAEKKQAVQTAWAELIKRASAAGVEYEPFTPKMTSAEMKEAYQELKARVVAAEEKSK